MRKSRRSKSQQPDNDDNAVEPDADADEDGAQPDSSQDKGRDVDKDKIKKDIDNGNGNEADSDHDDALNGKNDADEDYQPDEKASNASENSDDNVYEVEKVLDSKKIRGKLHYLVRWKGYQSDSDTWEPESTLNCPDLIAKYKKKGKKTEENNKKRKSVSKAKSPKKKSKKNHDSEDDDNDGDYENSPKSKSPQKKKLKKNNDSDDDDEDDEDDDKEYEVEKIVEVHHKRNGDKEFLIRWKGWGSGADTWEPESNLNCPDMIKKFLEKVDAKKNVDTRELRVARTSTQRFTLTSKDKGRRVSKRSDNKQRVRYDDAE